jgi:anti-anti-sigma factor
VRVAGEEPAVHRGDPDLPLAVLMLRSLRPRLAVRGPIDMATVAEFRDRVQDVGRGGSLPLEVDLTDVSHLASAGVQVLHQLAEQMGADGRALRLVAPPGCPAWPVLELTGLAHLVGPPALPHDDSPDERFDSEVGRCP